MFFACVYAVVVVVVGVVVVVCLTRAGVARVGWCGVWRVVLCHLDPPFSILTLCYVNWLFVLFYVKTLAAWRRPSS